MLPAAFHPAVSSWFRRRFAAGPTEAQAGAWPSISAGRHTLIAAPTGSGKTLAAFLSAIDALVHRSLVGGLSDAVQVVYVSPLKALSNDVRLNLEEPLSGIASELAAMGLGDPGIRTLVRTGDTPAAERTAMIRRPPHLLVTTPESLYILLTSESGRRMLRTARTVIVDEIHAVAGNKRGSHLSLTLARLDDLVQKDGGALLRIGLSATQRPIERVSRFLVGPGRECAIVDCGHRRVLDLALELPRSPLEAVAANEVWDEIYDRLAALAESHRSTLIFVATRRAAERVGRHLGERIGEGRVRCHHGSLSREQRFEAEQRLKDGRLSALVATASLELGIDVGSIDLVCNLGSTRSIATLLQRVGRSGHRLADVPKGRLFPTTRDELVECAALFDAIRRDELEELEIPRAPLDILAQQIVATVAAEEWSEDALFDLVRNSEPYRDLSRETFDSVVSMLSDGFSTRRGRRGALLHHDGIHSRLRGRRGARLSALTSGGAIPDAADYRVVLEPAGVFLGTVDEDFAVESMAGDVFQLGSSAWRILKVEQGRVLVEDARGQSPTIPFWLGEAPARSDELSHAVARLRVEVDTRLARAPEEALSWLEREVGVGAAAAGQIADYLGAAAAALGAMPSRDTLVLERFFDEAGNQHVVLHSPFGGRVNRAWGLALRKRFCRTFNFELQAAATEDAIVLSLGPTHSFPASETFELLRSSSVRDVLTQALLDAPMFPVRWRWNAVRSLALPRWRGGRRVPPRLLRMQAEDLLAVIFPDQLACLENIVGEREIPEHPLVQQTIADCLGEAMDVLGLERLLGEIEAGRKRLVARELREPSPLAHEVLGARPYAFLDDAPLEERRTQAVQARRWLDPATAADLGRLDPQAIERVRAEAWPEATSADELHDALVVLGFLTATEGQAGPGWASLFDSLVAAGRATRFGGSERELWVAAERLPQLVAIHPAWETSPAIALPARIAGRAWDRDEALCEIVRGRLESVGPTTEGDLAANLAVEPGAVRSALATLEGEGFVMQGRFCAGPGPTEWCERRLLARIHRLTLDRLRREIEPVSPASFMRFLCAWQRAAPGRRGEGPECLPAVLEQLEGFESPAAAWEGEILPARLELYDPAWLDALCLAGRIRWGRASSPGDGPGARPIRTTPLALLPRGSFERWREPCRGDGELALSHAGRTVLECLTRRGASFFDEIQQASGLLLTQVEQGLAELVGRGLATSDGYTGLRALLAPASRRTPIGQGRARGGPVFGMEHAGRWSLLEDRRGSDRGKDLEGIARALLSRWGVVFRRLLERESLAPPWRDLLPVYRRLEARGEIRGGRFVDGFSGEQFALGEAIGSLRAGRREEKRDEIAGEAFSVSAADPLNLLGIVLPGPRLPALTGNRVLLRGGQAVALLEAGEVRWLEDLPAAEQWEARNLLLRRRVPPQLRGTMGRSA